MVIKRSFDLLLAIPMALILAIPVALVALDWADDHGAPLRTALIAGHGSRRDALTQAKPLQKLFAGLGAFYTGDRIVAQPLPPIVYVD